MHASTQLHISPYSSVRRPTYIQNSTDLHIPGWQDGPTQLQHSYTQSRTHQCQYLSICNRSGQKTLRKKAHNYTSSHATRLPRIHTAAMATGLVRGFSLTPLSTFFTPLNRQTLRGKDEGKLWKDSRTQPLTQPYITHALLQIRCKGPKIPISLPPTMLPNRAHGQAKLYILALQPVPNFIFRQHFTLNSCVLSTTQVSSITHHHYLNSALKES